MISFPILVTNWCERPPPPCFNGAICKNQLQGYSCICSGGYMGENCSQRTSNCLIIIIVA